MTLRPAVFLDRDGVLNEAVLVAGKPFSPAEVGSFRLVRGAAYACGRLKAAGLPLIVVTNQPDLARGTLAGETLEKLHNLLRERLPVDAVYVCPHDDADGCDCRKPAPGLLRRAAEELGLDLRRSVMVGDRWKDVEAGRRAGCATVFVDNGYAEPRPQADFTVGSLEEAIDWILERVREEKLEIRG